MSGAAARAQSLAYLLLTAALGTSCSPSPIRGETGIRPFAFDLWDVHCPSGLRVIVERAPESPVVGVTALVAVGGRQDPPGKEGLAHLVEHLAFRSHAPDESTVPGRLAAIGGAYNASTSLETTIYFEVAPAGNLPALAKIEGSRR